MVWTTLWVGGGLLFFSLARLKERWHAGPAARWLLLTAGAMLSVSCLMRLVFGNEGKFLHLSMLLLAALAAPGAQALGQKWFRSGGARFAAMAAFFAPTTVLVLGCVVISRGHASERPAPHVPEADEQRLYDWLGRETEPRSAVLVKPPSLEVLVRSGRAQVWSESNYAVNWGYEPSLIEPRRRAVADAFGAGLTPADMDFLKTLRRPIYRVAREGGAPRLPGLIPVHREGEWVAERLNFSEAR
jgi:hypothetical protein